MSHYFKNDKNLKSDIQFINYCFDHEDFKFKSDSGVFSKSEIDYGSIALLKVVAKQKLTNKVLDLGCGYGTIGIIIKRLHPMIDVDMVDINDKAIALSKENCSTNKCDNNVFVSNGFENIKEMYDFIITNPPIRTGKEVIYKMFEDSKQHLNVGGYLYLVIRKSHGANSAVNKLIEIYGNCEVVAKDKGFYILRSKQA